MVWYRMVLLAGVPNNTKRDWSRILLFQNPDLTSLTQPKPNAAWRRFAAAKYYFYYDYYYP